MDSSNLVIDHLIVKYRADQKWTRKVIEQLTEEDLVWSPTPESNSIADLIAHISGAAHYWFEAAYFGAPLNEYMTSDFERGLQMTKEQALEISDKSYDSIIGVLIMMKANPERLLEQPYLDYPTFNSAALNNGSTILEMLLHQFRHLPSHTGQIIYIAKMRKGKLVWD